MIMKNTFWSLQYLFSLDKSKGFTSQAYYVFHCKYLNTYS